MPEPIIIRRDAAAFSAICDDCVYEKNRPHEFGREPWGRDEDLADAVVRGELPLDQDEAWVKCGYRHEHLVLREGSERAANFGYA